MSESIKNDHNKIISSCCNAEIRSQKYSTGKATGNLLILYCGNCGILFDGNGYELVSTDPKKIFKDNDKPIIIHSLALPKPGITIPFRMNVTRIKEHLFDFIDIQLSIEGQEIFMIKRKYDSKIFIEMQMIEKKS